jgi:hypothetical protein
MSDQWEFRHAGSAHQLGAVRAIQIGEGRFNLFQIDPAQGIYRHLCHSSLDI